MKLYIIRHGVTDWNLQKRLQGNTNTPLNEEGRRLARITAKGLSSVSFDYIFSSPLDRAVETAKIIKADRDVEIVTDERLIEMGFGVDEGKPIEERTPGVKVFFEHPEAYVATESAETPEHLCARAADFIDRVLVPLSIREPNANVMISGHGALNKALMKHLSHRTMAEFWDGAWQLNCSVFIYEIEGNKFTMLEEGKIFYQR